VAGNAATIIEASELLRVEGRARESEDWATIAKAMGAAAAEVRAAAQKKDAEGILAAGERLNNSCDNCHLKFQVAVE
jgi:cytochrome c556